MSPSYNHTVIVLSTFLATFWFAYMAIQDFRDARDATNFSVREWVADYAIQLIPVFAVGWILIYTILMLIFGLAAALWNGVSTVWEWIF